MKVTDDWADAEEFAYDVVRCLSMLVADDELQGVLRAVGIALVNHAFDTVYAVDQLVKLPFRLIGVMK